MVTQYIIREKLYKEETRYKNKLSQQVCINVTYFKKPKNLYESHRSNGLLIRDELIAKNVSLKSHAKLIVYVKDESLALELAQKWVKEEPQKNKKYQVVGINPYYSIFN